MTNRIVSSLSFVKNTLFLAEKDPPKMWGDNIKSF